MIKANKDSVLNLIIIMKIETPNEVMLKVDYVKER
jgi:hypothetical protein